ncbi:hypothetical protein SA2016_0854 [Sinomonas atrocyanea]|uniref:Uncharacterized protein n=1 Tax=Sinomonas atrocyanea TaxID=37927 RepID=A0A127A1L9_9MICC|nr:hypothetical protein [Sinomonas atrocyanea]AMM31542.1 hypothetical protein SA2016_0854 [Sinomonas atrocyanea]GEB66028.1 hypothetical protein SAT01_34760 [Sinomonas atrocyanea]GGG63467.1 hypothetical protein GCM10007172_13440 [Sinomonas atrocyanea]
MRILTDPDETQARLLPYLRRTEELLAQASSAVSGRKAHAEVVVLPDLGLPHNVQRIHGGFLTGAYYSWDSDVPMVPVDSTVNVCGVSVFRLDTPITSESDFQERVLRARSTMAEHTRFLWNWDSGNHFVTLCEVREPCGLPAGQYLVLHASTAEFKRQYNGLYPDPANWYSHEIEAIHGDDGRYLRYISGKSAEKFFRTARMLESYQMERQRFCAELVAGPGGILDEVTSVPHYGMPDQNSVAIGCQWLREDDPRYLLLTRPGAPLFMISAGIDGDNWVETADGPRLLTPHGLGVRARSTLTLGFDSTGLTLMGHQYSTDASLANEDFIAIRDFEEDLTVKSLLQSCPGEVTAVLYPIYSHYRQGGTA